MDQPASGSEYGVLAQVQQGMTVYDNSAEKIGTVDRVFFGKVEDIDENPVYLPDGPDSNEAGRVSGDTGFGEVLENVFDPMEGITSTVRERLLANGFVRISGAGLQGANRYILPEDIEIVSGDRVELNIRREQVMQRK